MQQQSTQQQSTQQQSTQQQSTQQQSTQQISRSVTTIYCLCDDFLRAWGYCDDAQAHMSTAEVMTVALVAPVFFGGNQERSRRFLKEHGYIRHMLSKSRLNRRLHQVSEALWQALFHLLAQVHQQMNPEQEYVVDSMPVPTCDNIRIRRCRLYPRRHPGEKSPGEKSPGEKYRGYCASKRRYVYGLRVHLLITATGQPVEVTLAPASEADIAVFRQMRLDLPAGATVFADAAYLDAAFTEVASEAAEIRLIAQRRSNSRDPLPPWVTYLCQQTRKTVETVFSGLRAALTGHVHAVTPP